MGQSTRKYQLLETNETYQGEPLYRLQATETFQIKGPGQKSYTIDRGELGGYVTGENNLSREGTCWIQSPARVVGEAQVSGNAQVTGKALMEVEAKIRDDAYLWGANIRDDAVIAGESVIAGEHTRIGGSAYIRSCEIHDHVEVTGSPYLRESQILQSCTISGEAQVESSAIGDEIRPRGHAEIGDRARLMFGAVVEGDSSITEDAVINGAHVVDQKVGGKEVLNGDALHLTGADLAGLESSESQQL